MKLNPYLPYGTDYSALALALFLQEENMSIEKEYSILDYAHYLYRFYSDIKIAKENHYYKIINEIWHYQPIDIYDYSKSILKYVEENIGLVSVYGSHFCVNDCPKDIEKYSKVVHGVIQALIMKFIGGEFKTYDSRINLNEVNNNVLFEDDSRVFYRALETINYCFISDETDLSLLCAVRLKDKKMFDINNYIILSKEYGKKFLDGSLRIKKNGYPYLNNQRLYQHIDINTLKKIRQNLEEI